VNKSEIVKVLASYSPPLSPSQIDEAAEKIVEIVAREIEPLQKPESKQKSRR